MKYCSIESLEIKPKHGLGVFTNKFIPKNTTIERAPTLNVHDDEIDENLRDYLFTENDKESVLVFGYGSMYNSSKKNNLDYYDCGKRCIGFITNRDINAGEELTINYGDDYWNSRK